MARWQRTAAAMAIGHNQLLNDQKNSMVIRIVREQQRYSLPHNM